MSYGASNPNAERLAGSYVGRILNGDKGHLAVQQSVKVELFLNVNNPTAKAGGLPVKDAKHPPPR